MGASFDKYAVTLLLVECRWLNGFPQAWLRIEDLFEKARASAYCNNPNDKGGPTFAGITLSTYRQYYGRHMSIEDLKHMAYHEWRAIFKTGYWDVMQADKIENQSIADLCVDWLVNSGVGKVRNIQRVLGVQADGVVGPKTLAAINDTPCPMCLHTKIKEARETYYRQIVTSDRSQSVFLMGWLNRLGLFNFSL